VLWTALQIQVDWHTNADVASELQSSRSAALPQGAGTGMLSRSPTVGISRWRTPAPQDQLTAPRQQKL
jgi:hypothetical protein